MARLVIGLVGKDTEQDGGLWWTVNREEDVM